MEVCFVTHLKRQAIRIVSPERPSLEYGRLQKGSIRLNLDGMSECRDTPDENINTDPKSNDSDEFSKMISSVFNFFLIKWLTLIIISRSIFVLLFPFFVFLCDSSGNFGGDGVFGVIHGWESK